MILPNSSVWKESTTYEYRWNGSKPMYMNKYAMENLALELIIIVRVAYLDILILKVSLIAPDSS